MKPTQIWKPQVFLDFSSLVSHPNNKNIAKKHSVRLLEGQNGHYVDKLTNAASKWRVANSITSFNAGILSTSEHDKSGASIEAQISQKLCDSYSAQMQISLAVFAFEAYAKCFGKIGHDWYTHKQIVFKSFGDPQLAARVRSLRGAKELQGQLEAFLGNPAQKGRLNTFFSGDDHLLYDFCHFVRHAYAHGALRGYDSLIDVSNDLKKFILMGIKSHLSKISSECQPINRA